LHQNGVLQGGEKIAKYNFHAHLSITHQLPKMVKVFLWRHIGPLHLNSFAGNVIQVWISQSNTQNSTLHPFCRGFFDAVDYFSFIALVISNIF
jgi:hypothetical protein